MNTESLQDLVNSVNTLRQKVDAVSSCSASLLNSNRNSLKSSEFHLTFESLTKAYCEFAEGYRCELDEFHKILLNNIRLNRLRELQKENERERLEIEKEIEIISTCNSHSPTPNNIDIGVNDNVYSPTPSNDSNPSIKYEAKDTDAIKSETVVQSVAVTQPISTKKAHVKVSTNPIASIRKVATPNQTTPRKSAEPNTTPKRHNKKSKHQRTMDSPYAYNSKKVQWRFNGPMKSSTVIFIGNLPSNDNGVKITAKKVEFYVMQKAHVTISQIEKVNVKRSGRGLYALVRFSRHVSLHKIRKFMDKTNGENQKAYVDNKGKNGKRLGWKKQVFMKFNRGFIKTGDAMWTDKDATHRLFIRNFDILNAKCHYDLTQTLLEYGDLYRDIDIRVDGYGDPYCIVTFKYINEAIYCCNTEIGFNGRMLEIRYAKY